MARVRSVRAFIKKNTKSHFEEALGRHASTQTSENSCKSDYGIALGDSQKIPYENHNFI